MNLNSKDIQNQYQGYKNTPLLWENRTVFELQQFELPILNDIVFNEQLPDNLRLGKRVERFVSAELRQLPNIEVVLENTQVQNGKRTIGELDCILIYNNVPIHLEVVYKFYLYDNRIGLTEIEHWVGPNLNDTLIKKLTKLKERQLPLLYSQHTQQILDNLKLNINTIKQQVYFKAQLFVPYKRKDNEFKLLNQACLNGFYIYHNKLKQFSDCKFYIPTKINWLLEVQIQFDWLNFQEFSKKLVPIVNGKTSPLCWIKFPNGILKKLFVVWWN